MRAWIGSLIFLVAATAGACGGTTAAVNPAGPTQAPAVTGTWTGTASDSSGTAMGISVGSGMGMGMASAGTMTWQITQNGNSFMGTVTFSGFRGGTTMSVTGTINGRTGTFAMTMPDGSMPMARCTGTTAGTFDMDDMLTQMNGAYAGSTTCNGPFDHGQMTLAKK